MQSLGRSLKPAPKCLCSIFQSTLVIANLLCVQRPQFWQKCEKTNSKKVQRWCLFKPKLCAHVKICRCVSMSLDRCLVNRNSEAIYQQLHFVQRPQCCSCIHKLFKMYEKMEWRERRYSKAITWKLKKWLPHFVLISSRQGHVPVVLDSCIRWYLLYITANCVMPAQRELSSYNPSAYSQLPHWLFMKPLP